MTGFGLSSSVTYSRTAPDAVLLANRPFGGSSSTGQYTWSQRRFAVSLALTLASESASLPRCNRTTVPSPLNIGVNRRNLPVPHTLNRTGFVGESERSSGALHRSAPRHLRSRADLRGPARRSVHVLSAHGAAAGCDAAVGAGTARRRPPRSDSAGVGRARARLWSTEGLAATAAQWDSCCPQQSSTCSRGVSSGGASPPRCVPTSCSMRSSRRFTTGAAAA